MPRPRLSVPGLAAGLAGLAAGLAAAGLLCTAACGPKEPVPPRTAQTTPTDVQPAPSGTDPTAQELFPARDSGAAPISPPAPAEAPASPAVDEATVKVRAMLAALPVRKISPRDVCRLVGATGFHVPGNVVRFDQEGLVHAVAPDEPRPSPLVPRCEKASPYGGEVLTPLVTCEDSAPRCTFYLVSGGKNGTPLPPTERTYWFDMRGGKLTMVAVALPQYQ